MKSFCIIGLGSFGRTLAEKLARAGHQVMVIDEDTQKVNLLSDLVTDAVIGDPTNENVLKDCGVRNYDCCINCFYENLNDSVLVTVILKELGVKEVIARAGNQRHKNVLEKLGADMVVFPEQDMGEKLADTLMRKNVLDYFELHNEYAMAEVKVPEKWIGKNLIQLDMRKKYSLSAISVCKADGTVILPPVPDALFEVGDVISVIGRIEDVDRIAEKN
ncbi:MAG: TrkA family potassium uptake protein [Ruminococcaceae bacterium]|nr:TrkA family potassium uptake protein [Oscillospiraceae bacterium]